MTNSEVSDGVAIGLLGVEIGRNKVRLCLLDHRGAEVLDLVERPIAKAGGPRDPIEQEASTRAALVAALDRLGLAEGSDVLAGATIGFSNCGVGSGPALHGWLESLSEELEEPLVLIGEVGISYAPARCVEFVQRVFDQSGLRLDRVELAPVAAARVMGHVNSAALSLGSGIAWTARVLDDQVLEAFEATDGPFDDDLRLLGNGSALPRLALLERLAIDDALCRNRGVAVSALAPAAGVAIGLLSTENTNLLDGRSVVGPSLATAGGRRHPPNTGAASYSRESAGASAFEDLDAMDRDLDPWPAPVSNDTYELRRVPQSAAGRAEHERAYEPDRRSARRDEFDGIESFAYAESQSRKGLQVPGFVLGALVMLAIVLAVALVIL